jgi:hypothetical protein
MTTHPRIDSNYQRYVSQASQRGQTELEAHKLWVENDIRKSQRKHRWAIRGDVLGELLAFVGIVTFPWWHAWLLALVVR